MVDKTPANSENVHHLQHNLIFSFLWWKTNKQTNWAADTRSNQAQWIEKVLPAAGKLLRRHLSLLDVSVSSSLRSFASSSSSVCVSAGADRPPPTELWDGASLWTNWDASAAKTRRQHEDWALQTTSGTWKANRRCRECRGCSWITFNKSPPELQLISIIFINPVVDEMLKKKTALKTHKAVKCCIFGAKTQFTVTEDNNRKKYYWNDLSIIKMSADYIFMKAFHSVL